MVVKCDVNGPHILNDGKKTLFKQRHKRQYGYTCVLWSCWLADSEGIWNVEKVLFHAINNSYKFTFGDLT